MGPVQEGRLINSDDGVEFGQLKIELDPLSLALLTCHAGLLLLHEDLLLHVGLLGKACLVC